MNKKMYMKACVVPKYGTEDDIVIKELERPVIKPQELLIKVHYAPVTPTDLTSKKGDSLIFKIFSSLIRPKKGVYGEMYVGTIEEIGKDVSGFTKGELVYGTNGMKLGTYAEYVCVKRKTVIRKVPEGIDPLHIIALLDGGITALPFLRDKAHIKKDNKVLVIGASGSVGSMGVQLAKHFETTVTGVSGSSNQELLKTLGCDHVIDYTETDYTNKDVKYDIIFDAVGKSSFKACESILNEKGSYLTTVPNLSGMVKAILKIKQPNKKSLFAATGLRKITLKHQDLAFLEELLLNNEIRPYIEKVYDISDMTSAQKHVRTGHKKGNVIVNLLTI